MRDLRRRALESHKTTSRKARSLQVSAAASKNNSTLNSPAQSRAASRNPSRQTSDDDEDYLSDDTTWSGSQTIDGLLAGEELDISAEAHKAQLHIYAEQIENLKRSSTEGRAESLNAWSHVLMARFAQDEVKQHIGAVLPSILRSIKTETTERETVAALRALAVTIITLDSDEIYDSVADQLKRTISSSESIPAKIGAIHTLGTAAFFGGTSEEELAEVMALFLEIIESDGLSIDAHDSGAVVIAALEEWGFLATALDDVEDATEDAMEAFVEQLESSDAGVQIAAGENIALLYEKSYTPVEEDEEVSDENSEEDEETHNGERMVKRYNAYRRQDQLLHTLDELATVSSRRVSKKDRKTLHSNFADIRNSVEKPMRGPKYSTAIDELTGKTYGGGRMRVKINRSVEVIIDKWWKLQRLNALRRVLQAGFTRHFDENEAVSRCLPFSMVAVR